MVQLEKEFFYDEESGEVLGVIAKDSTSWLAQTIFGYTIARTASRKEAESTLQEGGLAALHGTWQYFDPDEKEWLPCVLQEVYEKKVVVVRTNEYGIQEPNAYKQVTLMHPTEENLVKLS